jgi:hypothetical protein
MEGPLEPDRRRRLRGEFVAPPAVLALGCASVGIAWFMIGAFVLGGAATAVLRLSMWDPLGLFLGTGELAAADLRRLECALIELEHDGPQHVSGRGSTSALAAAIHARSSSLAAATA